MLSIYNRITREEVATSKCSSRYASTSSTPVWALLPTEKTEAKERPLGIPASMMKTAVAPEPEMRVTPCGSSFGMGVVNTPL